MKKGYEFNDKCVSYRFKSHIIIRVLNEFLVKYEYQWCQTADEDFFLLDFWLYFIHFSFNLYTFIHIFEEYILFYIATNFKEVFMILQWVYTVFIFGWVSDNGGHLLKCWQLSEFNFIFWLSLVFTSLYCILYKLLYF